MICRRKTVSCVEMQLAYYRSNTVVATLDCLCEVLAVSGGLTAEETLTSTARPRPSVLPLIMIKRPPHHHADADFMLCCRPGTIQRFVA